MGEVPETAAPDLRAGVLGLIAWLAALAALRLQGRVVLGGLVLAVGWLFLRAQLGTLRAVHLAWVMAVSAVVATTLIQADQVQRSGLAPLVNDRASVQATLVVRSDPVLRHGRFADFVRFRATISKAIGRGRQVHSRAPVLVIADASWAKVRLNSKVKANGRFDVADDRDLAGVLTVRGPPSLLRAPAGYLRGVDALRASIRRAIAPASPDVRALVPALVDGDDTGLADDVAADFRTSGLTHLLAVSGTNLTLIVGFLLIVARWSGVRARGLVAVGVLGVIGFILLARTEPSVLRAAAMGSVALIGMGLNGRDRGVRTLGVAVLVLMLFDPWLATSVGFGLSVCATGGIVLLAPGWRDALMGWLPRWLAEAIAVPLAAQLACTPLVAAISGQVSLVAVAANLVVAMVVGPATVLGLLGGVCGLFWGGLGQLVAAPAGWCAQWIITVARASAGLPVAAVGWSAGVAGIVVLTTLCAALCVLFGRLLARRGISLGVTGVLVFVVLIPLPTPGWPAKDWVLTACDVGQGDALVLNAGAGRAIVVDAGPDPRLIDACLHRLRVRRVSLVLLTHFHADHIDGLAGVLAGRSVGKIVVSPVADPLSGARQVHALAVARDIPVEIADVGSVGGLGQLRWQVLAPTKLGFADSDSPPNDASVVLLVEVRGVRLLLMGDQERPSQAELRRVVPGLRVDVLKVAHHGSSKQDENLIEGLGARLGVISVGVRNDYGHPAPSTLQLLKGAGMKVVRTDQDGDVAVIVDQKGRVGVRTRMPSPRPVPGSVGRP